jgi:hypothetical protein
VLGNLERKQNDEYEVRQTTEQSKGAATHLVLVGLDAHHAVVSERSTRWETKHVHAKVWAGALQTPYRLR